MNGETTEKVTKPRIVPMKKGSKGYGFNLHGEKGVQGQFISAVDDNSPAQLAGLKSGDRVVEVNGVNIEAASHSEVVQRIKTKPDETELLVVDKSTDEYLKSKGIPITRALACIESATVDSNHNESTQENSELEKEVEQQQDTTKDEDELDAVRQMEAATLESSEGLEAAADEVVESSEVPDVAEAPSIPEPEIEVTTTPEVEAEPETNEEAIVPEPEPELEHVPVDNGIHVAEAEVVESVADSLPDEITPEEPPVPTEPNHEPVSEPAPAPVPEPVEPEPTQAPEPVPVTKALKKPDQPKTNIRMKIKQESKDWKTKKEMFEQM